MNIVKFQDTILNESNNKNMLSEEKVNLFNNKLKGKYAYAINFKHVVPFEDITFEQYYEISKNESAIDGITYIELIDILEFVDQSKTQIANSITVFEEANKFTTDSDITIDELKRFRTWLADMLYTLFNDSLDSITKEMLNYYREEMNTEGDTEPIGIVLGAYKDKLVMQYALQNISNQVFVSRYQLYLPDRNQIEAEFQRFLGDDN